VGRERDSLSVMTSLVRTTGVYARNTGMYARKKAVTATASDITLSIGRFRYGGQYTDNVNVFFLTTAGMELKFRTQIQKSGKLSGFPRQKTLRRMGN
jgi:hypothetical protein